MTKTERAAVDHEIECVRCEAMGCILAIIDSAREMRPRRGTPVKRALRQFADASDKTARKEFDGWDEFVAYVREKTRVH